MCVVPLEDNDASIEKMTLRIRGRKHGSLKTVSTYSSGIRDFAKFLKVADPQDMASQARSKSLDVTAQIDSWINQMIMRNLAPKSMTTWLFGVKKWLRTNDAEVNWNKRAAIQ